MVAYDYAKRNSEYFRYVMLYFVLCHMIIVLITATLIKSTFWSVYFTVSEQY
jgi:hypothetical protein